MTGTCRRFDVAWRVRRLPGSPEQVESRMMIFVKMSSLCLRVQNVLCYPRCDFNKSSLKTMDKTGKRVESKERGAIRVRRRALLGAISGAGVVGATKLPGQWTRPVVDHVLLPAHAATTDDTGAAGGGNTTGPSTFITTVTSNCVITCTSANGMYGYQTAPWTGSESTISSIWYTYYVTANVTQCIDSNGGVTSSYLFTSAYTALAGSGATYNGTETSFSSPASYTSNAMCYVTMTSS